MDTVTVVKVSPEVSCSIRCGVCHNFLVIPPIYSCKSARFICGPCFEGHRYYLNDDDLRAADNPIRQILYENYARKLKFPCTWYPYCKGDMYFDQDAKLHYTENCFAKVLWIFKCPISKSNRWFLKPDQKYCNWVSKLNTLYDDANMKMLDHLSTCHSEYILWSPHVLYLHDLKYSYRQRQLFIMILGENNLAAVLMTEITKTEIIFRCRVNDNHDQITSKNDPFECCVTLIPPNERFSSMVDLKFECVRFDSNDVEYPWQFLRLPLRHLVEETMLKISVYPRSVMLRSMPYFHRERQLFTTPEDAGSEGTLTGSEGAFTNSESTMSVVESNKTDIELLSFPSSNSEGAVKNNLPNWETEDFKAIPPSPPSEEKAEVPKNDSIKTQESKPQSCPEEKKGTAKVLVNRNLFNVKNPLEEDKYLPLSQLDDTHKTKNESDDEMDYADLPPLSELLCDINEESEPKNATSSDEIEEADLPTVLSSLYATNRTSKPKEATSLHADFPSQSNGASDSKINNSQDEKGNVDIPPTLSPFYVTENGTKRETKDEDIPPFLSPVENKDGTTESRKDEDYMFHSLTIMIPSSPLQFFEDALCIQGETKKNGEAELFEQNENDQKTNPKETHEDMEIEEVKEVAAKVHSEGGKSAIDMLLEAADSLSPPITPNNTETPEIEGVTDSKQPRQPMVITIPPHSYLRYDSKTSIPFKVIIDASGNSVEGDKIKERTEQDEARQLIEFKGIEDLQESLAKISLQKQEKYPKIDGSIPNNGHAFSYDQHSSAKISSQEEGKSSKTVEKDTSNEYPEIGYNENMQEKLSELLNENLEISLDENHNDTSSSDGSFFSQQDENTAEPSDEEEK